MAAGALSHERAPAGLTDERRRCWPGTGVRAARHHGNLIAWLQASSPPLPFHWLTEPSYQKKNLLFCDLLFQHRTALHSSEKAGEGAAAGACSFRSKVRSSSSWRPNAAG
jgi:hypothetical protein